MNEVKLTTEKPARLKMSYEEFLRWSDEDTHAEWVDGEVIVHMPPKEMHQTTLELLYRLLILQRNVDDFKPYLMVLPDIELLYLTIKMQHHAVILKLFVELFDLGQVHVVPFEMKLSPGGPSREPDILFVAAQNLARLTDDRLEGPADLVVEIISPDSVARDRKRKFNEYQQAGGGEYWLIDPRPEQRRADFFYLDESGLYHRFGTQTDDRVESRLLAGFWLNPAWLGEAGRLDAFRTFCRMAGLPNDEVEQFRRRMRAGFGRKE